MKKKKNITIKTIAQMAGVAPSTVSRVVNNSPGVGDETREEIWKLVREYNYQPNAHARNLVKQQLQAIGVLIPSRRSGFFENPFFADVMMGAAEIAAERDYDIILYTGGKGNKKSSRALNLLRERKVDGLIAVGLRQDDPFLPLLRERGMEVVLVNRRTEDSEQAWVSVDNKHGAYQATRYLLDLGHRRIGFIDGPANIEISSERREGYLKALRGVGLVPDPQLIVEGDFDEGSGYVCARRLRALKGPPTAIFASNDLMAIGALNSLRELGLRVPEDVSVIGFDNIHSCYHVSPPLSTVKLPAFQMGQIACNLALDLIEGATVEEKGILLPTQLVIRQSTGKKQDL